MSTVNDIRQITVPTSSRKDIFVQQSASAQQGQGQENRPSGLKKAVMHSVRTADPTQAQLSFVFPFTPQQIDYSNMSPELTEISRPGKQSLIAFNKFRARQIAFKFLIAVPQDGMFISIDDTIEFLYGMANTGQTVYFTDLDRQITNPLIADDAQRIFWSITDLTFQSIRRNENNKITAAEANITLVENINPTLKASSLPKISYTSASPTNNSAGTGSPRDANLVGTTWSQTLAGLVGLGT